MAYGRRSSLSILALVLLMIACVAFAGWQIRNFVRGPRPMRPDSSAETPSDRSFSRDGMLRVDESERSDPARPE